MSIKSNIKAGQINQSLSLDWKSFTANLTLDCLCVLDPKYDSTVDTTSPVMQLELYSQEYLGLPRVGGRLPSTYIPTDFYPNVPWRCVSKQISQIDNNEDRLYKITANFEALGVMYDILNTPSVRLLAIAYAPENYDFAVRYAYKNKGLWDDTDDQQNNPTKLMVNTIGDPLIEGERQVRSIGVLKFTMEYDADSFVVKELDTYYNNTINGKGINILGRTIAPYRGLLNIDNIETYAPNNETVFYRISYSIKIKNSIDAYDTWVLRDLNQGFRFKSIVAPTGIRPILNSDINKNLSSSKYKDSGDQPVSEPQPLTQSGAILTDMTKPYWLYFQVQPIADWTRLAIPETFY